MKKIYLTIQLTSIAFLVNAQSFCNPSVSSNVSLSATSACPNGVIIASATGGSIPAGAFYYWEAMTQPNASTFASGGISFGPQGSPVIVVNNAQFIMPTTTWINTYYIRLMTRCSNGSLNKVGGDIAVTKAGPPIVATPTTQVIFCPGSPASIAVTTTAGTTFSWTKDGVALAGATTRTVNFASPTASNTGVYRCIVTNACGTATSSAITYTNLANQFVSGAITTATNSSRVYSVPDQSTGGVTYTWTLSGGGTITSAVNSNSVGVTWGNAIGDYTLSLNKTRGACQVTDSRTISVIACTTNTILVQTNGPNRYCENQQAIFSVSSSGTYTWSTTSNFVVNDFGNGFASSTPTTTSIFTVNHIDATSCPRTGTIEIVVDPLPQLSISSTSTSVCANQSTTLSVSGTNFTGNDWGTVSSFNTITPLVVNPLSTTTYTANAYNNSLTCKTNQTITIFVVPNPAITITASNPNICTGQSSTLTAGGASSYTWSANNATTNSIVVSPTTNTTYTLNGTNGIGCIGNNQTTINVGICTGISELNNTSFSLFPNPAKNVLITNGVNNASYNIINMLGEIVLSGKIDNETNTIDISNLNSGMYFISLTNKGVKRFIKE